MLLLSLLIGAVLSAAIAEFFGRSKHIGFWWSFLLLSSGGFIPGIIAIITSPSAKKNATVENNTTLIIGWVLTGLGALSFCLSLVRVFVLIHNGISPGFGWATPSGVLIVNGIYLIYLGNAKVCNLDPKNYFDFASINFSAEEFPKRRADNSKIAQYQAAVQKDTTTVKGDPFENSKDKEDKEKKDSINSGARAVYSDNQLQDDDKNDDFNKIKLIKDSLKTGVLTKDEAESMLKEIQQKTKEAEADRKKKAEFNLALKQLEKLLVANLITEEVFAVKKHALEADFNKLAEKGLTWEEIIFKIQYQTPFREIYSTKQGELLVSQIDHEFYREIYFVLLNNKKAPDGKYKLGFAWYIHVEDGRLRATTLV